MRISPVTIDSKRINEEMLGPLPHVDFEGSIYCTYQSRPSEVGWFKDIKEGLIGEFSFQSLACTTKRYVVIHCISDQPFYFSLYGIVGGHSLMPDFEARTAPYSPPEMSY